MVSATQTEVNGGVAETTTYTYDSDDRLKQVAYPDKTTAYTYDPAYNRLTEKTTLTSGAADTDRTYAYNPRNQLTGITDNLSAANSVQYSYDANGNQTIKTKNGVTTTFVYDVRDELVTVLQNATTLGLFHYDYQGLRISKDMGGQVLRYTYDDNSVLLETDNTGATVAKFDYGAHHLLSLTHVTEGREFYLFDGLGSVADLTTLAGSIQARYQYDAFGNFRAQAGSSFNRFAFTGHEKDNETGLYYFKARYYDPDTGRFLSQDEYEGDVDTPPSLHKYLYAYANPTVYVDPTGHIEVLNDLANWLGERKSRAIESTSVLQGTNVAVRSSLSTLAGVGAGLFGVAEGITRATNFFANAAVSDVAPNTKLGRSVAAELDVTFSTMEKTAQYVTEHPHEVASKVVSSTYETAKAAVSGDAVAIAQSAATITEIVTPVPGAKGAGQVVKSLGEAVEAAAAKVAEKAAQRAAEAGASSAAKLERRIELIPDNDFGPINQPTLEPGPAGPSSGEGPVGAGGDAKAGQSPQQWSDAELQSAVDTIHQAQFPGQGKGIPITVTVSENGRVVVTQVGKKVGPAARAKAEEIFGPGNVEFPAGTTGGNAAGEAGFHSEARGIKGTGEEAQGARQASTHYACDQCAARQAKAGVVNVTGTAAEHGGKITREIAK